MSKSIKTNYFFNLLNTISGLLFPLITFPYASRILLAEGIGQVSFFQSIIQYITLLTCLGIPMYAIREIAKVRDNVKERNKIAIEILLLHASLTIIGYIIVAILTATVAEIKVDIPLFLILSTTIFFTAIGCEWFYQGVEDFKYITIRGLIVKTVSVVLLFLLVKSKTDILWYAGYSVLGVLGGNIFNFVRLQKYISIKTIHIIELNPTRHILPALRIFVLNLIVSIYVQLNSIMLGFIDDAESVGLFTAASKITHMLLGLVTSLGVVILPRLSNFIATGQNEEFRKLVYKALQFVIAVTLPISVGLILVSSYLIPIFCGNTYQMAILTLQIMAPIVLFIGIGNLLGAQILYPQGQENKVILSTAVGALVNVILNFYLIPHYSQNGAAVATLVSEIIVTICLLICGYRYIPRINICKCCCQYFIGTFFLGIFVWLWIKYTPFSSDLLNLLISMSIGISIYSICMIVMKDSFYLGLKSVIIKREK